MKPITDYTDRELLELAAAHCGKKSLSIDEQGVLVDLPKGRAAVWNPLTEAGDRARMCDELCIDIMHIKPYTEVSAFHELSCTACDEVVSDHNNSRTTAANYAAVRLVAMMQIEKENGK